MPRPGLLSLVSWTSASFPLQTIFQQMMTTRDAASGMTRHITRWENALPTSADPADTVAKHGPGSYSMTN